MERAGEHAVPVGPLAVRWLSYEVEEPRAGVTSRARLRLENAGSAPWRSRGTEGVQVSYHWLDPLGNPIVWDGRRTPFPHAVEPGATVELDVPVLAPRPPGSYRLAFDLVEELRFWFQEVGSVPLEESGLAPKEAWCNESQERYVLAIAPESLERFAALADRERCPFAVVGVARDDAGSDAGEERRTEDEAEVPL